MSLTTDLDVEQGQQLNSDDLQMTSICTSSTSTDAIKKNNILTKIVNLYTCRPPWNFLTWVLHIFVVAPLFIVIVLGVTVVVRSGTGLKESIDRDTYFEKKGVSLPNVSKLVIPKDAETSLSKAIQLKTISFGDSRDQNTKEKIKFLEFLKSEFPLIHSKSFISVERIGNASVLYRITGKNPALKPYLLIAHYDVVPTDGDWDDLPFSGKVKDGFVYGRGSLDNKASLVAILTALEMKLASNASLDRTLMVFSGHDEEVGGNHGAKKAAQKLKSEGIELEFVLDEGGAIVSGLFPGIEREQQIALICVTEKGYMTVEVETHARGGHSSMPPGESAIVSLSKALVKLQENPFPIHFGSDDINRKPFDLLGPYFNFCYRCVFLNLWLFKSAILTRFTEPAVAAQIRTTTAVTVIEGGIKENVLPISAKAWVNHRIHPSEDLQLVLNRDREIIGDPDVTVRMSDVWYNDPPKVSPHGEDSASYQTIKGAIHASFPTAFVVPSLTVGGTDSKHFVDLTNNIYRFIPYILTKDGKDARRIHGLNERIGVENYFDIIRFYSSLFELADEM